MNTPVKFELAKLLKEKDFDLGVINYYSGLNLCIDKFRFNYNDKTIGDSFMHKRNGGCYSAPTIAEVVCWIYSKYDIWISLIPDSSSGHRLLDRKFSVSIFKFNMNLNVQAEIIRKNKDILYFNLPENAFDYAINYILNTYEPTS